MGIISSRDTRRISFDNTFALGNSALPVPNSIQDESIVAFDELAPVRETANDTDKSNYYNNVEVPEEREIDYWTRRIENLKKEHQNINNIVEEEFDKHITKTNQAYEPPVITHEKLLKLKPCFDWRSKIMQCYEDNPHQPLVCSPIVQAFSKCVTSCRTED